MKAFKLNSILLVDDDEDDGYLFKHALKEIDESIKYFYYRDSEQALRDLKASVLNPDFIFLDLNMQKLNGFDMLRELKAIERFMNTPIIVCSTTDHPQHIDGAKKFGAAKFICKPQSLTGLVKEIKKVLTEL